MLRRFLSAFLIFKMALITLTLSIIMTAAPARAQTQSKTAASRSNHSKNAASILLRWVDVRGNLYPGGRVTKMSWVWSRATENDSIESPALRLWVSSKLPANWKPKKLTGDGVTIIEPFREGEIQTIAFDLRSSHGTLRFEFTDPQNKIYEMTLSINVNLTRPYILVKPECNKNDLKFLVHKTNTKHLFVGLNCLDKSDSFDIYFFRSKDSLWNDNPGLVKFDPQNRFTAFKYHVSKPKEQVVYSQRLFRVGTKDEYQGRSEYSIFYNPKAKPNVFYISAGLGFTFYKYTEINENVEATQMSLTGKTSFGFRLIPRVLDLAFNFFGNIVTLNQSAKNNLSNDLPTARFYGLNGRLGYRLPLDLGATEFMFLTGWYFWGMLVPIDPNKEKTYGIQSLSGPQLFITMLNSQAGHAGWWWYVKLAMISERVNITSLSNNEIATGLGFELSSREKKPFSITLDIAKAQYTAPPSAALQNGMKILSVTAGIQKSL